MARNLMGATLNKPYSKVKTKPVKQSLDWHCQELENLLNARLKHKVKVEHNNRKDKPWVISSPGAYHTYYRMLGKNLEEAYENVNLVPDRPLPFDNENLYAWE